MHRGLHRTFRSRLFRALPIEAVLVALFSALTTSSAFSAEVKLGWDPNTEADLAGYRIHYGTSSRSYTTSIDVGIPSSDDPTQVNWTVSNLEDGLTFYFAATAYDWAGNESDYSNEVVYSPPPTCSFSISPAALSFEASGGTGTIHVAAPSECPWTLEQ